MWVTIQNWVGWNSALPHDQMYYPFHLHSNGYSVFFKGWSTSLCIHTSVFTELSCWLYPARIILRGIQSMSVWPRPLRSMHRGANQRGGCQRNPPWPTSTQSTLHATRSTVISGTDADHSGHILLASSYLYLQPGVGIFRVSSLQIPLASCIVFVHFAASFIYSLDSPHQVLNLLGPWGCPYNLALILVKAYSS
jgi:hypothetical protein